VVAARAPAIAGRGSAVSVVYKEAVMVTASTVVATTAPIPARRPRQRAVAGIAAVGGALMIGGALLPWLSVYAGLDTFRGVDGTNGRVLLGGGVLALVLGIGYGLGLAHWLRWVIPAVGFAASGFAAWVVAQLLGTYQQLQSDGFVVPSLGAGAFLALTGGVIVLATLLIPHPADGAVPRKATMPAEQSSRSDARNVLLSGAVAFLLCAALIHLAVVGPHLSESSLYAAFFVCAGLAQIVAALALTVRTDRRLLGALAIGNALIIGVWALSRSTGLPIGPTPGAPESVSLPDVLASVAEGLVVVLSITLLRVQGHSLAMKRWLVAVGMVGAGVIATFTTVIAIVGVQSGGG